MSLYSGIQPPLGPLGKKLAAEKALPFVSESPMMDDPDCSWASFHHPRLRACTFPRDQIVWRKKIGMGMDGVTWKVKIGGKPYAIKVFWDDKAPPGIRYWAAQRECHNVALLQMIQASIAVAASDKPIYLRPRPENRHQALENLFACSQEGRLEKRFQNLPDRVCLSSTPRIRECFGWMQFSSQELSSLPRDLRAGMITIDGQKRYLSPEKEYYAIVYEYIPNDMPPLDDAATQEALDFFWLSGFTFIDVRPENWLGGIVLDMACFVSPVSRRWSADDYERVDIESWPKNFFHGPAPAEESLHQR